MLEDLHDFAEKWLSIARNTTPATRNELLRAGRWFMDVTYGCSYRPIFVADSPYSAYRLSLRLADRQAARRALRNLRISFDPTTRAYSNLREAIASQESSWRQPIRQDSWRRLWHEAWMKTGKAIEEELRRSMPFSFHAVLDCRRKAETALNNGILKPIRRRIGEQMSSAAWSRVDEFMAERVDKKSAKLAEIFRGQGSLLLGCLSDRLCGPYQFSSDGCAAIDYCRSVLGVRLTREWPAYRRMASLGPVFVVPRGACVVSNRPIELHCNDDGLHREGGPALVYADGWCLWALNGAVVPRWLAETDAEKIDGRSLERLYHPDPRNDDGLYANAGARREFIRKVGVDPLLKTLDARVIDSRADKTLLSVSFRERRLPLLKQPGAAPGDWELKFTDLSLQEAWSSSCWRILEERPSRPEDE